MKNIINRYIAVANCMLACGCETWVDFEPRSSISAGVISFAWEIHIDTDVDIDNVAESGREMHTVVMLRHKELTGGKKCMYLLEDKNRLYTGYDKKINDNAISSFLGWLHEDVAIQKNSCETAVVGFGMGRIDFMSIEEFEKYLSGDLRCKHDSYALGEDGILVIVMENKAAMRWDVRIFALTIRGFRPPSELLSRFSNGFVRIDCKDTCSISCNK